MLMKQAQDEGVTFHEKDNEKLKDAVALTSTKKIINKRLEVEEGIPARWRAEEQQQHKREDHHSSPRSKFRQPRDDKDPSTIPGSGAATTTSATTVNVSTSAIICAIRVHYTSVGQATNSIPFEIRYFQLIYVQPTLVGCEACSPGLRAAPACPTGIKVADRQEDNNCPGDASDDRLEENDEEGDEEGSFTGGGGDTVSFKEGDEEASFTGGSGDTRSFKSRRSTRIDIIQDKCSCDESLVDFVPGPGQYAESVGSTSSGKSRRQGTTTSSTSTSNSNRQAIAGGSSRTSLPTALSISATVLPPSATSVLSVNHDTRCKLEGVGRILRAKEQQGKNRSATMANGGANLAAGGVAAIFGMKITGGTRVSGRKCITGEAKFVQSW
ncbi:hypothetical protein M378DRAFT_19288 [Amanita muscaria Koide BX008]|uniref:Uncharacterized protein n=1 Tax=Amanita muscaria (strain Koide BX008) TaxID=946122 RepID=A0A0C2SJE8_AMAMK|nr:hypothetical protein M378DRAFT_19288 [Amanita muscaria Koide BX008]